MVVATTPAALITTQFDSALPLYAEVAEETTFFTYRFQYDVT